MRGISTGKVKEGQDILGRINSARKSTEAA